MSARAAAIVVTTAVASQREADDLAGILVVARLAACVQTSPIRSTYRWKGKVERAEEVLLVIKTSARRRAALMRCIREHHPYELPEILVTPIHGGLPAYLRWIQTETT